MTTILKKKRRILMIITRVVVIKTQSFLPCLKFYKLSLRLALWEEAGFKPCKCSKDTDVLFLKNLFYRSAVDL